jgi:hypothetical protein
MASELDSRGERANRWAWISYGIGAASVMIGSAVYLVFRTSAANLSVAPSASGVTLTGQLRF